MAYLFVQEAVSLFVGDTPPDNDKGLILESIKLPMMEEMMQTHHPGGSWGEIEVCGLGMKALTSTFKVKGWDPQSMSKFGLNGTALIPYTCYGAIRNKNGNGLVEVKAVMRARLSKIEHDDFKRGDLLGHQFELKEILHYELFFDKAEKFFWDFFARAWRVDGVNKADFNAILRVSPG